MLAQGSRRGGRGASVGGRGAQPSVSRKCRRSQPLGRADGATPRLTHAGPNAAPQRQGRRCSQSPDQRAGDCVEDNAKAPHLWEEADVALAACQRARHCHRNADPPSGVLSWMHVHDGGKMVNEADGGTTSHSSGYGPGASLSKNAAQPWLAEGRGAQRYTDSGGGPWFRGQQLGAHAVSNATQVSRSSERPSMLRFSQSSSTVSQSRRTAAARPS